MSLGERIKKLRKSKNLSLRQFSSMVDISISFLSDIENGRSNPSLERLKDIAKVLEVRVSYLLGENNDRYVYKEDDKKKNVYNINEPTSQVMNKRYKDLPCEAIKEIENYIQYIKDKYKKK